MKLSELFTNADGHMSTTASVQFLGFVVLAGGLIYALVVGLDIAESLYKCLAMYCGGLTASKGIVTAYKSRGIADAKQG